MENSSNLMFLSILLLTTLLGSCSEKKPSTSSVDDNIVVIKKSYYQADTSTGSKQSKSASKTDSTAKKTDGPCTIRIKPEWKVSEQYIFKKGDSISFGSESQRILYPLGEFDSVESTKKKFPNFTMHYSLENPDSTTLLDMYLFENKESYVKIFRGHKPQSDLELMSATIKSLDVKIYGKVFVGMTRKNFESIFFLENDSVCSFHVYSFAYIIDSEIQHFTFEDDKLVKIQLQSNFVFQ